MEEVLVKAAIRVMYDGTGYHDVYSTAILCYQLSAGKKLDATEEVHKDSIRGTGGECSTGQNLL